MIDVTRETIDSAFECLTNHERYSRWFADFQAVVNLYTAAERAFAGQNNLNDFEIIYEELRGRWQVFRGTRQHWDVETIYSQLNNLDQGVRALSLSRLQDINWLDIWNCVCAMREIKQTQSGPSLVAISKFLHFWNPHLFVIFDNTVVESWVFGHKWLSDLLCSETVDDILHRLQIQENGRLSKYLRVLIFADNLLRENPYILEAFAQRVAQMAEQAGFLNNINIGSYEAIAVEHFLMGLVELPPGGVEVQR